MDKLLVVEDHPLTRIGVCQLVRSQWPDSRIDEVSTVAEAATRLSDETPDIIVMDLNLPDAKGLDGLGCIRQQAPAVPVLVLSVHAERAYAKRCLQDGARGYLSKERAAEELLAALNAILGGGSYVTRSLAAELGGEVQGAGTSDAAPHDRLSPREYRILLMLGSGQSTGEVAKWLQLSPKTVSTYRARVLRKLALANNVDLARYCLQHQLVEGH
jgi:DNA-binding NarL/FixJ family response regulator